ncbi:MAG: hypothetical protein V4722_13105 [Bacteroidota bacterium]
MLRPVQLLPLILITMFLSCSNDQSYRYAIKDFRKSLHPYLLKIVSRGIVMHSDSCLRNMATDNELIQLSKSEHPVLRASAFKEILHRKSFHHFDNLMNHLDDTAMVIVDQGEFGLSHQTVSDDILQGARWKTQDAKRKTIDNVLTKHNYLTSAYQILSEIAPQEKYYSLIKDMATRPRRLSYEGYELGFDDIEYALYGLAKFKKKGDVKIIKMQLLDNNWRLSHISFRLMTEFPDTAYIDILRAHHRWQFYNFSGNRRGGFSGYVTDRSDPEDFIQALVVQQNERSAKLLDTMLTFLPKQTCMPDKENILKEVRMQIWKHPCPAYARLRENIKFKAKETLISNFEVPSEYPTEPTDTTTETIRW